MKKNLFIPLSILAILVLGACVFGGVYLLKSDSLRTSGVMEKTYVDLGEIKVNLSDNSKKFFKGNISVGYDKNDKTTKKQLQKDKQLVVAKDAANFYFKSKSYDFLNNSDNIDKIKDELITTINSNLQNAKITDVKFSNFIVQ